MPGLESFSARSARPGSAGPRWRDRVLDALLPNRGAIANARDAVESDRAAAWQRDQASLALDRAARQPVDSPRRTAP